MSKGETFEGPPFEGPPSNKAELFALRLRLIASDIRGEHWDLLDDEDADELEEIAAWVERVVPQSGMGENANG